MATFGVTPTILPYSRAMKRSLLVFTFVLLIASNLSSTPTDARRAAAIDREMQRLAGEIAFWPGYEPLTIPLAIYTGEATYLFRHPAPPEDFVGGRFPGRHPAVTSNSSAEIGGVMTATLLADGPRAELPARTQAAVALHEAFHVFQRKNHPHWIGNEGDLFLYPFEDGEQLALRRRETEALRRGLAAEDATAATCWIRRALEARQERFAKLAEPFRAYERGNEWNEGLAQYIQEVAAGQTTMEFPGAGFGATELRLRFYTVGPALAFLLDRFRDDWKAALEADDQQPLDALLAAAVAPPEGAQGNDSACAFTTAELEALAATARADAAQVVQARIAARQSFDALPGKRVVIEAGSDQPLWPQGFDPLNVQQVEGGLLHTRFLRLGNEHGEFLAVDGEEADLTLFTVAAGEHPLFNGVRRAEIAGLTGLEVTEGEEEGTITLKAPGLTAQFKGAAIRQEGEAVRLSLVGAF